MGKNITVYIQDELLSKMEPFEEVNWSEIARKGIENYLKSRGQVTRIPNTVVEEFQYLFDFLSKFLQSGYRYSLITIYNDFPADISSREREMYSERFTNLIVDTNNLQRQFMDFRDNNTIDNFKAIVISFIKLVERHSKCVRDFVTVVRDETSRVNVEGVKSTGRTQFEFLDIDYSIFREKYNRFIMDWNRFIQMTKLYHNTKISDHILTSVLLAPRIFKLRISSKKVNLSKVEEV